MINKKSVWFLTLFSLILVLSVYYITMPSELLIDTNNIKKPEIVSKIEESTILTSLKIENEDKLQEELNNLKSILNSDKSINEKNKAFNKMKELNMIKGEESKLVDKIKKKLNLESFVKIDNNQIEAVVKNEKYDNALANKIIRLIQEEYDSYKYITIRFIK